MDVCMLATNKKTLRQFYRQQRDSVTDHASRSEAICASVARMPVYQVAHTIHCYIPMRSEVDTFPLLADALAQGKHVIVPIVQRGSTTLAHARLTSLDAEDLLLGEFGTLQPKARTFVEAGQWDMVIVPLLAFNRQGYRLGYGGGFYDRLLATLSVPTVGVAFAVQEAAALPCEEHDVRLGWVVTESEIVHVPA